MNGGKIDKKGSGKYKENKNQSADQIFHFQTEIITVMVSGEIWAIYSGIAASSYQQYLIFRASCRTTSPEALPIIFISFLDVML